MDFGMGGTADPVLTSDDVLGYVTQKAVDLATSSSVNGSTILTENSPNGTNKVFQMA